MQLDAVAYLFISQLLISFMLSVVFLVAWFTIERKPYTLLWSLVFGIAVINGLMNALRGYFPDPLIYWTIVSATSLGIQGCAIAGFRQRAGQLAMPGWVLAYFIAVELLVIWFTMVQHHMGLRMMFVPASAAIVMGMIVNVLLRHERERTATTVAACTVFFLYGLSQLTSAVVVMFQGAESDPDILALYQQINFIAQPACFAGMGLFTALILADDLARRMRSLAMIDPLSSLTNRRGFDEDAARALSYCRRQQIPLTVVIADIDHFKQVNDEFGHKTGDHVIQTFSKLLTDAVREEDAVARIGGEEFILLLQGTSTEAAIGVLERLRAVVEETEIQSGNQKLSITASFGIAGVNLDAESIEPAMQSADEALYRAKELGRNRVEVAS